MLILEINDAAIIINSVSKSSYCNNKPKFDSSYPRRKHNMHKPYVHVIPFNLYVSERDCLFMLSPFHPLFSFTSKSLSLNPLSLFLCPSGRWRRDFDIFTLNSAGGWKILWPRRPPRVHIIIAFNYAWRRMSRFYSYTARQTTHVWGLARQTYWCARGGAPAAYASLISLHSRATHIIIYLVGALWHFNSKSQNRKWARWEA